MSLLSRALRLDQPVMHELRADVIAGPITAAELGVPEGSIIESRVMRRYRSRWRQLWWSLHHRDGVLVVARGEA